MYGIYYNSLFDSLMISASDQEVSKVNENKDKNTTILESENGIVGINMFHVSNEIHIHQAFNSFNKDVIEYITKKLNGIVDFKQETQFVVGQVLECEPIEGTHLHLCKINIGDSVNQIVCGAKNIDKDQLVVVALTGAWMPNGQHIIPGKLRGFDSNGMVCSTRELALQDSEFNQDGIIVLPDEYKNKIGKDFFNEIG